MIKIYSPRNHLEAQGLQDMLASHHIHAHISGAYLQGAVGELPAHDLLGLHTDIADADRARELVNDWLNATPMINDTPEE